MTRAEAHYRSPGNWGKATPRYPRGKPTACDFALVDASTGETIQIYDTLASVLSARRAALRGPKRERRAVRIVALSAGGHLLRPIFRRCTLQPSGVARVTKEVLCGWAMVDKQALFTDVRDVEVGK